MPMYGRRMVFARPGQPLECREVEVAAPDAGGVVVRTVLAGVCGTDAHRLGGDLPVAAHAVAFGHEGIGRLELLGDGVTTDHGGVAVAPGDLVYWSPSSDRPGAPPVTGWPPPADIPSPASYQDYAYLPPSNVFYRVPDDADPEAVIAFGCAMPTAVGGVSRLGGIRPEQTVVVQGSGPVGLAATCLAGLAQAEQVIVIGAPVTRLAAAERLGATATIPLEGTSAAERSARVRELTHGRGADIVIEAAGRIEAFGEGLELLGEHGRYLIIGLYSGRGGAALDVVRLNNLNQSIIGSMGPAQLDDYRTAVRVAQEHGARLGFADLITHRFPLTETEEAIRTVASGATIKAVVMPEVG
jgi:threonine dehydrogenase-like Zn-dependent dehydrogenase